MQIAWLDWAIYIRNIQPFDAYFVLFFWKISHFPTSHTLKQHLLNRQLNFFFDKKKKHLNFWTFWHDAFSIALSYVMQALLVYWMNRTRAKQILHLLYIGVKQTVKMRTKQSSTKKVGPSKTSQAKATAKRNLLGTKKEKKLSKMSYHIKSQHGWMLLYNSIFDL